MTHTEKTNRQKIVPNLWFDDQAEDAVNFYTAIFANSKIGSTVRYNADTPSNKPKGSVMIVEFEIEGQKFTALNVGALILNSLPLYPFSSIVIPKRK